MTANLLRSRRELLGGLGAGIGGVVAGCSSLPGQETQSPTPASDERVTIVTRYYNERWQELWSEDIAPSIRADLGLHLFPHPSFHTGESPRVIDYLIEEGTPPEGVTGELSGSVGEPLHAPLSDGYLTPVTNTVTPLTEINGDLIGEPATIDGENYLVPHGAYTDTIHYRTDVLDRHGLDPPETLGKLLHNAEVIDEASENDPRGFALPVRIDPATDHSGTWFRLILNAHGVHLWRWADGDQRKAEVWFPEEEVHETLAYFQAFSEYSPTPEDIGWGRALRLWRDGAIAQMYHLNGWGAGVAAELDKVEIARTTDIVPVPTAEGKDPFARGRPGFDGFAALGIADNVPGFLRCLQYMYATPERAAKYYAADRMRFLPAYSGIMETDEYASIDLFQQHPFLLELNQKARNQIASLEPTSKKMVITPATIYAESFHITGKLVHQVIVEDRSIGPAIQDARSKLKTRLVEGQRLAAEHFQDE